MHPVRPAIALFTALIVGLSACSITPQPPPATTTPLVPGTPAIDLVLLDTGIGPFIFGDTGEAVIEGITDTIGGWDADSSDNDAIAPPVCKQGPARIVSWGSLVLTFVARGGAEAFTGWAYGFDPLTGNSYDNRRLELTTPEGIGLGSPRDDLIDAYDTKLSIIDDTVLDTAAFVVSGKGPAELVGKLDGAGTGGAVDFIGTTPNC